ncbi:Hydrogen cyanide synthase subunit HcnC [Tetrabaena socialis]|uniref:Hydrogen cyanide synthase subunit HcnC n=1 Tax=Tetrabaena socialis TaxID=47790 RepID=A0A2J7ZYM3_9CHLO|nr:Hydrogen cyanide synthase subunit HcnC [Tetrabaena socialis]|eukprot:PNH05371.1 Hydrogen cyanide synthase subunit HcnC [Tetrabaena socialis]
MAAPRTGIGQLGTCAGGAPARHLNLAGLRLWKAQWPQLVQPCGSLLFDDNDSLPDPLYPAQQLEAEEVLRLEPAVAREYAARGAKLYAQEAWVDPQAACAAMLEAAQQAGAEVLLGQDVERLLVRDEPLASVGGGEGRKQTRATGVVTADGAVHLADVVVLAAGTSVQRLAAQAGVHVPLLHKPAVVAITQPLQRPGRLIHHMLASAKVFVWQRPDGSLMLGDSRTHEDGSEAWGQSLLQRAAELVPELRSCGARVSRVEVAYRPWPQDGHPVIGASPSCRGLYVAVMHSGMTLAPEVGRLVAAELAHWDAALGGPVGDAEELREAQAVLMPYRLARDFEAGAKKMAYGWK